MTTTAPKTEDTPKPEDTPATKAEAKSDVVHWTDENGRKHTGSRHGSAYREHARGQAKKK